MNNDLQASVAWLRINGSLRGNAALYVAGRSADEANRNAAEILRLALGT